jgi:hypothetical protein
MFPPRKDPRRKMVVSEAEEAEAEAEAEAQAGGNDEQKASVPVRSNTPKIATGQARETVETVDTALQSPVPSEQPEAKAAEIVLQSPVGRGHDRQGPVPERRVDDDWPWVKILQCLFGCVQL